MSTERRTTVSAFMGPVCLTLALSISIPASFCQPADPGQGAPPGAGGETGAGTATAQPVILEPTGVGVGQSGTGFAGPGRLVRIKSLKNDAEEMRKMNKLNHGEASEEEQQQIAKIAPGTDPRNEIAAYACKLSGKAGSPFLMSGQLMFVSDEALSSVFPRRLFYLLRFRQWPVGFAIPQPLRCNNIFSFDGKGLMLITDSDELRNLFRQALPAVTDAMRLNAAVEAWLRLREELVQDGMFQFSIKVPPVSSNEWSAFARNGKSFATGELVVNPVGGNTGALTAKLTFNAQGELESVEETNTLRAGMRPICQSTKLLDPDPIVRKMAEQDLLIMGKAAKPYLDEQRPKVSPRLRKAIDDIWQRILLEDR